MNVPWHVTRGVGGRGEPVIVILAGKELVLLSDKETPTLFNHIVYLHNKSLQVEIGEADVTDGG